MSAAVYGYIRNPRSDLIWFIALPFAALALALGFHHWLPYIAQASIALWITLPHHYATWVRSYGLGEDWERWKVRLTVAPLLLIASVLLGSAFIPVSLALVLMLWDHQHSIMQQHGFARVYDFKAGTGSPQAGRLDFWLGVVLYGNMLVVAPLWGELWIAESYRWDLGLQARTIETVQTASWTLTGVYAAFYVGCLVRGIANGYRYNPMKYLFLFSSYSLWYFVSFQDSFLIYAVSHRIMHGVQYILMVYWYIGRKVELLDEPPRVLRGFTLWRFVWVGLAYAALFQFVTGGTLGDASFGLIEVLQQDEFLQFSPEKAAGFYAATAISAAAAIHYYYDSFIWKVSDTHTQEGL